MKAPFGLTLAVGMLLSSLVTALTLSFIQEVIYEDLPCGQTIHFWQTDHGFCGEPR